MSHNTNSVKYSASTRVLAKVLAEYSSSKLLLVGRYAMTRAPCDPVSSSVSQSSRSQGQITRVEENRHNSGPFVRLPL